MGLLNRTTEVPSEQTIAEIQRMLTQHGVIAMMTDYDGPHVEAVSFKILMNGKPMSFRLPCNWRAVEQIFKNSASTRYIYDDKRRAKIEEARKAQAIRTAWRIIHTWVKAQLALIEVNMVTLPQVFLPYAITKDGRTLAEAVAADPGFLLGDGK